MQVQQCYCIIPQRPSQPLHLFLGLLLGIFLYSSIMVIKYLIHIPYYQGTLGACLACHNWHTLKPLHCEWSNQRSQVVKYGDIMMCMWVVLYVLLTTSRAVEDMRNKLKPERLPQKQLQLQISQPDNQQSQQLQQLRDAYLEWSIRARAIDEFCSSVHTLGDKKYQTLEKIVCALSIHNRRSSHPWALAAMTLLLFLRVLPRWSLLRNWAHVLIISKWVRWIWLVATSCSAPFLAYCAIIYLAFNRLFRLIFTKPLNPHSRSPQPNN